jgi:RhtB (resistance to homoserine/threonine) family protein
MSAIHDYWMFLVSGIILNITPGSDTIYILTRSISQGRKAGLYSVLGISTGCLVHTFLASLGLSIVLARSVALFSVVKYIGALYLVFLGVRTLLSKTSLLEAAEGAPEACDAWKVYRQGLLTNVLNPKVALFFLSFLPQFIDPGAGSDPVPFLVLGLTFFTTGTIWCLVLSFASSLISRKLRENKKIGRLLNKAAGAVFIGLGMKIALEKK